MDENKKPCAPVEEESRDRAAVFQETDPLCAALDELCMILNCWYAAMNSPWQREDREYRKELAKRTQAALKRILQTEGKSAEAVFDAMFHKSTEDYDKS